MIVIDCPNVFIQTISGGYANEEEDLPNDVYNPTDIDVILDLILIL